MEATMDKTETATITIDRQSLYDALTWVLPCVKKHDESYDSRPQLEMVCVQVIGGKLRLVTADSYRLAKIDLSYYSEKIETGQYLLDPSELQRAVKEMGKYDRAVFTFEDSFVTLNGARLDSLEATYPNYMQIIPRIGPTLRLDRGTLETACKTAIAADSPTLTIEVRQEQESIAVRYILPSDAALQVSGCPADRSECVWTLNDPELYDVPNLAATGFRKASYPPRQLLELLRASKQWKYHALTLSWNVKNQDTTAAVFGFSDGRNIDRPLWVIMPTMP